MKRLPLLILAAFALASCVRILNGTVSTAIYSAPPPQPTFAVAAPDPLSLTDRNISGLIERKMLQTGYIKAPSSKTAKVVVLYRYSIGPAKTDVSSSPDFVWGGQKVESTTTYPRFFEMVLVDTEKSSLPEKIEIIWQGEVRSRGSSENISELAGYFIDVLFENFLTTVTNKTFHKIVER